MMWLECEGCNISQKDYGSEFECINGRVLCKECSEKATKTNNRS